MDPRDRREARRRRLPRLRASGGVRRHGPRHGVVLPRDGGARPRRLVRARDRLGQQRARRQDDREVGDGGAEGGVAAADVLRRGARLLRADGAGQRLRSGVTRHARRPRRRRLGAERVEDLHHARLVGGRRAGFRAERRRGRARHHVLPRADVGGGLLRGEDRRQARPARAGHGGALPRRRARSGLGAARRRGRRLQGRDVGARQRPHLARRRLGRHRAGLRRRVDRVRERSGGSSASRSPGSSSCRS